jgi:hypothetical protein
MNEDSYSRRQKYNLPLHITAILAMKLLHPRENQLEDHYICSHFASKKYIKAGTGLGEQASPYAARWNWVIWRARLRFPYTRCMCGKIWLAVRTWFFALLTVLFLAVAIPLGLLLLLIPLIQDISYFFWYLTLPFNPFDYNPDSDPDFNRRHAQPPSPPSAPLAKDQS